MNQLVAPAALHAPPLVATAGNRATYRFLEFFTAQIRNPHTRRAYVRAVSVFCAWLEDRHLVSITAITSVHIAAYIEELGQSHDRALTGLMVYTVVGFMALEVSLSPSLLIRAGKLTLALHVARDG